MRTVIFLCFLLIFQFASICPKAQNIDSLKNIHIIVTFNTAPTTYSVTKAPLRYNKLFAFSMGEDDGDKDIYTNSFQLLNGGTVSGVTYPGLKYTDGCGNDVMFKMSAAIFPFYAQGSTLIDIHDPNSSYASSTVTWPQLTEMYQQNWSVMNHGLTSGGVGNLAYEIARNTSYTKLMMQAATSGGPDLKMFVNPNGTLTYSAIAWAQGYTACFREGYTFGNPSFDVTAAFPHQNIGLHRTNTYEAINLSAFVDNLANTSVGGERQWGSTFTHAVTNNYGYSFTTFVNHMNYIASTYGKTGLDNILMATDEEILDYLMVRDSINVVTQLLDNVLTISFTGNLTNRYRFYNSTLLISANRNISSIVTQGVGSSSSTGVGSSSGMVNISWNGHYVIPPEVPAQTWISTTQASHSQEDANVAIDYIMMVPPGAQQRAFRTELCQVSGITLPSDFCTYRNAPVATLPVTGACPGHPLVIPVAVDSFLNITSCSQRIEYDPAVMTFVSGIAGKPSILSGMTISDQAVGGSSTFRKILISWTAATAKSLSVHDTLALLTFNYISGNTALSFNTSSNSGSDCKYIDEGGHPMYKYPVTSFFVNGQVNNARLAAPGSVSGPSSLCQGTANNIYSVLPVTGATSYAWTFPSGFVITQGANHDSVVVTAGPNAVSGDITVRAVNTCNDNPVSSPFPVNLKSRPVPVITGPASSCATTQAITYSTDAGMTEYSWSISSGGNLVSGQGTNSVTVNWVVPGSQTLSVIYRAPNGCLATVPTVKNVTVNPLPVPVITGSDTVCSTSLEIFSTSTGMQSYQWNVSPSGTILSGASTSSVTVRWDNTGPQWISLNYSNSFGCQALSPVTKNIFVRPIAQPVITGPVSLCEGDAAVSYASQAGMTNYTWLVSSGGVITSGSGTSSVTVQWNSPGIHQMQLNYNFPGGCPATSPYTLNVNVHARPQPHIYGPDTLCKGSTGNVYTTESGMSNYQWTVSPGGIINSGSGTYSVTTDWTTAGNQFLGVNYMNSFGCAPSAPLIQNIRINPLPVPAISGPSSVCNNSGSKIYTTQPGKTNYIWVVSPGGNIVSGQGHDTLHVIWNSAGNQQLSVNYADSNSCSSPVPVVYPVTVYAIPSPSIAGPQLACSGVNLVYTTQTAMSNYTWAVSAGGIILSGQGSPSVNVKWNLAGNRSVSVNYSNSSDCSADNPFVYNVTVNPTPSPTITGNSSICFNSNSAYTTETGMNSYVWTVSAGGSILSGNGSSSILVAWNASGDQSVTLSYTNPQGCPPLQPAQKLVRVHPLPVPFITGPSSVCSLSGTRVYSTQRGKTAYNWTVSSGGLITSGQGTDSVGVNWTASGIQHLTVTYLDSTGCAPAQPTSYPVTVLPLPVPSISGPPAVCSGVTGLVYSTQSGMSNYQWSISSGGTILSGLGTETIQVRWDSSGSRYVSVNYSNSAGCYAPAPVVKIVTVYPLPAPTITGPDSLCMNATGTYTTESGMSNYQWVISAGGSTVSGLGTNVIHVTWTSSGPRTVSVNYINGNNCTATSPSVFNVNIFALPVPAISGNGSVCANSSNEVYTTESGMSSYSWTVAAGGTITSGQGTNSVQISWGNPGTSIITVSYTSPKGCNPANATQKAVTINPLPVPTITGNNSVCANSGPKTYSTQAGQLSYTWNISAGDTILTGLGTSSITAQWNSAGAHWITVTYSSPSGCQAANPCTLTVTIHPLPSAASVISGPSSLCVPASWQEYSIDTISNADGYFWTLPARAIFQGNPNSNIIHVTYLPNAQSDSISVHGSNACGNGTPSNLYVNIHPYPSAPTITLNQDNTLISSSAYGNQWHLNDQPMPGDTLDSLHVVVTGEYYTLVTLGNCSSDTSNIKYVVAVGVNENMGFDLNVHPNPTNALLDLVFTNPLERAYKVVLINELGVKLYESERLIPKGETTWRIDLRHVSPGPVLVIIQSSEGIIRKKVIKN